METTYTHPFVTQAHGLIQEQLEADFAQGGLRQLLSDYQALGRPELSLVEVAASKLGMSAEQLLVHLARVTSQPVVELNLLPLPKVAQFHFEGLPLYAVAWHPAGVATLATSVPFLEQCLPLPLLLRAYGVVAVHFVLTTSESLHQFSQRLYHNEMLTAAWFGPALPQRQPVPNAEYLPALGVASAEELSQRDFDLKGCLARKKPREDQPEVLTLWGMLVGGLPYLELAGAASAERCLGTFPAAMQRRYGLWPVSLVGHMLTLASPRSLASHQRAEIANMLPPTLRQSYVLGQRTEIDRLIIHSESKGIVADSIAGKIEVEPTSGGLSVEQIDVRALSEKATDVRASVVDLVKAFLIYAVQNSATDIHISEHPQRMWVRYRMDGVLQEHPGLLKAELTKQVIARIKILSGIDTQYSALPQDGKFSICISSHEYDIRVCTSVTIHGDKAVLRLQPKLMQIPSLERLGFKPFESEVIQRTLELDHGLLILCGPTGAGKSTTLYAAIGMIDRQRYNVCTAEQPVEIRMPQVEQTDIRAHSGLTFARFIESVLRQDPDYIMIGETRDRETAAQVLRAAITGHTVLTTLHTNSAAAAPSRLYDLECEPFLLADALSGVCAQRLLRRICPECSYRAELPNLKLQKQYKIREDWLGKAERLVMARGCNYCRGTGYRGRFGIMEAFLVDEPMRELLRRNAPVSELQRLQVAAGGRTLHQQAVEAAAAGLTTLQEAMSIESLSD